MNPRKRVGASLGQTLFLGGLAVLIGCTRVQISQERQLQLNHELVIAALKGDLLAVRGLVNEGAEVNCRAGSIANDETFIRRAGRPIAASQWTPMIAAASSESQGEHLDVVRLLIARGAAVNLHDGYGATALYKAVALAGRSQSRDLDIVQTLLEAGAGPNTNTSVYIDGPGDISHLHSAIRNPHLVGMLIRHKADVDAMDSEGRSVIYVAVQYRQLEAIRLLIKAGAKVNVPNRKGYTPLSHINGLESRRKLRLSVEQNDHLTEEMKRLALARLEKLPPDPHRDPRDNEIEQLLRSAGAHD